MSKVNKLISSVSEKVISQRGLTEEDVDREEVNKMIKEAISNPAVFETLRAHDKRNNPTANRLREKMEKRKKEAEEQLKAKQKEEIFAQQEVSKDLEDEMFRVFGSEKVKVSRSKKRREAQKAKKQAAEQEVASNVA